jgi:hypothetical protein
MHLDRHTRRLFHRSEGARQFSVRAALVGWQNAADRVPELIGVLGRLRQDVDMRAEGEHLALLARIQVRDSFLRFLFRARQVIAVSHAEGIVDGDHEHFAAAQARAGAVDKRIGEGKSQEEQQRDTQGKQEQISQAAVLERALGPLLEKHQRTELLRRAAVLAQHVNPKRQSEGRDACQEPWREESHYILP